MSDLHLTIDGQAVTVPSGTTVFDAARLQRHRDSHAVPSAERNAGGRLPRVRGGSGRARSERVLRAARRRRHDGGHQFRQGSQRAAHAGRAADGRSSFARARARASRAIASWKRWLARKVSADRASPSASRRAARTIRRWPSPWITKPASCATAAFAAATRSATTTCWAGAARVSTPASPSI